MRSGSPGGDLKLDSSLAIIFEDLVLLMLTILTLRIDVSNPLSAFDVRTKTKLSHTFRGMDVKAGKFLIKERPGSDGWRQMGDFVNNIVAPLEVNLEYDEEQGGGTFPKFHFLTGLKCSVLRVSLDERNDDMGV